jgi:outer membrane protein assembly factor BamB
MPDPQDQEKPFPPPPAVQRSIRWWPFLLLLIFAAGAFGWVGLAHWRSRQDQNIALESVVVIGFAVFLLAWLFLSRLRWKLRLLVFGAIVAPVVLVAALFRIRGVTGDLVPVLQFRWAGRTLSSLPRGPATVSSRSAPETSPFTNDYPQFLGPNRNATVDRPRLARDWKTRPPQRLWRQPVGAGWSGFAVAGHRALTLEQRGEFETVSCYDLLSGTPLWGHADPVHFQSSLAGEGPRATPTVAGHRVYTLGSTGLLNCLELETGKGIWSKDVVRDNQGEVNEWGMSCSPLVVDDLVVVSVGGRNDRSLVAYRAATGEFVWGDGNDGAGYSSPRLAFLAGVPQILIFNSGGVSAHEPRNGKTLWKYHWPGGHPHVSMPVVLPDDRVLISSGYGVGSELIKITKDAEGKFTATRIWKSNRLKAKFTNLVYRDGFIYGLDDGVMVCLDAATGEQKWKEGRYGHGQEILVLDLLLVTAESGQVLLLEPNSEQSRELTRFRALNAKTWNPPALAGEYLLVRNDKEAACYRLPTVTD